MKWNQLPSSFRQPHIMILFTSPWFTSSLRCAHHLITVPTSFVMITSLSSLSSSVTSSAFRSRTYWGLHCIVRENVRNTAKKRKKSRLFGFSKKRKKTKKRRGMPIVMKTTVTTLNQFCCLSHSSKAIIF